MSKLKQIFMSQLDEDGIKYRDVDPDAADSHVVELGFSLDKQPGTADYWIFFDKDNGNGVHLMCQIAHFDDNQLAAGYKACNEMNATYRWVKFFIDDEHDLYVVMDDMVSGETVTHVLMDNIGLLNSTIPETYPHFMKAMWA